MPRCPRQRFIRAIPGRMRVEVFGLKRNSFLAQMLLFHFKSYPGIHSITASIDTGKALIYYDAGITATDRILEEIMLLEKTLAGNRLSREAAATEESNLKLSQVPGKVPPYLHRVHPNGRSNITNTGSSHSAVPVSLVLSTAGAGILGIRQLLSGRSALAKSPALFQASALVSFISGYPGFHRKYRQTAKRIGINPDILLGTGLLGLALLRQNIIVLAGLSLLSYIKWQKSSTPVLREQQPVVPTEIRTYSEKTGMISLLAAGTAWAVTRQPFIALAVLLAGNPRIVSATSEYTWEQAALFANRKGLALPDNMSLYQLSRINTVLLKDTALISTRQNSDIRCLAEKKDEAKVWHLAASIMKKTNHAWQEEVMARARQYPGTIRTAFQVQEAEQGLKATVRGSEILFGDVSFLRKQNVDFDQHLIELKRMKRHGAEVLCLAKDNRYLGCLVRWPEVLETPNTNALKKFRQDGLELKVLGNSPEPEQANPGSGKDNVLLITRNGRTLSEPGWEHTPTVAWDKVPQLQAAMEYARSIKRLANQNFQIGRVWNKVGSILGIFNVLTAPLVNFIGDYLTLLLLSRSRGVAGRLLAGRQPAPTKVQAGEKVPLLPQAKEAWHTLTAQELLSKFSVREETGLLAEQVTELKEQFGPNVLEQRKAPTWWHSYLGQFKEFSALVVLGTSLIALFSGGVFDGLAMGAIMLANAAIGTVQERKADKVIDALNEFQPPQCKVIRDGRQKEISGSELVPGDIVCLEAGDRVPADIRLLRTWNLEVNESTLTGESLPLMKTPDLLPENCLLADCKNMLYLGTDITRGKGQGIVVGTGMNTEMGKLMNLLKHQENTVTPLHEKVTGISKTFVKIAAVAAGLVFLTGIMRGIPLRQIISTSITLAASAVPEGLPVTITIALSAGIFFMARKNVIIRKLAALENLGRATVICTDKTGTLTKNEMTVKKIATIENSWKVGGSGYDPQGTIRLLNNPGQDYLNPDSCKELECIARIGLLCNNSTLKKDRERWQIQGDPTEGALLTLAAKLGFSQEQLDQWHRVHEVPFDSNTGSMSVVCRELKTGRDCYMFCKGSVEALLEHCMYYQQRGQVLPLIGEVKQKILEQNIDFAGEALRVLGFAYAPVAWVDKETSGNIGKELIYVGLVGMMDPPKPDVEKSIQEAYALGVKPVMITGDHPITAIAIAKELGIGSANSRVLTGQELDQLSDQELSQLVAEVGIFARVTPEHKLRIVKAYQARGHIVAMTGDGVNDTPAIRHANIGISMGTGTEVTKSAADMVLKENHFGSILEGIKQGRFIIGNIRKAIGCLLTGNLAEILVTGAAVLAGLPIPLVPIQILLMNILTDCIPAMILAVNPGNRGRSEQSTLTKDVADRELYSKVITRGVCLATTSLGIFFSVLSGGASLVVAQTAAFATLVTGQFLQTFSWGREGTRESVREAFKDRYLIGGLGVSSLGLLAAIYIPPFARFFHTAPLNSTYWLAIILATGSVTAISKIIVPLITGRKDPHVSGSYRPALAV